MRVKTVWFSKQGARAPAEIATVVASTLWRLADTLVDNLSKAGYDIITPARGFKILAEVLAFGLHLSDRAAHGKLSAEERAALVQGIGSRLGQLMEENVRPLVGEDGRDYRAEFIDMLNRRGEDYATFDFPENGASFPALRYLGAQIREVMDEHDQHWIMDQVMDIEMPEVLGTLKKTLDGLFSPAGATPAPRRMSGD
jgi:hypothetical protein